MSNMKSMTFLALVFAAIGFWAMPTPAQTFSSGSTGSLGALNPATNTNITLPADGILNYTTINIPSGVTVTFTNNTANTPVIMLATGDVTITGTINVNGAAGTGYSTTGPAVLPGATGGPGGFLGGQSGSRGLSNNAASDGQGPGGGAATSGGFGSAGATYGAASGFVSLLPLFGGSGGGGYKGSNTLSGISGGGGGGAIVIASSTKITVSGSISAKGGQGGPAGSTWAGGGSGGAVRLVAPEVTGAGTIDVNGGVGGNPAAGPGRVRLEAFKMNFTGSILPSTQPPSISTTCGPVNGASTPALASGPTLVISTIAGVSVPSTTTGNYSTADVSLPSGTTNPVSVVVTATNITTGSTIKLKHIPQFAQAAAPLTTTNSGTFASSTATFSVTLPVGTVSVLNVYSDYTLP